MNPELIVLSNNQSFATYLETLSDEELIRMLEAKSIVEIDGLRREELINLLLEE